jgi:hypothetical protein
MSEHDIAAPTVADGLRQKLERYLVEWPSRTEPPPHAACKQATAVPFLFAALARIEAGTYGVCADCEERIPKQRLALVPGALRCAPCQCEEERSKHGGRRRGSRPR